MKLSNKILIGFFGFITLYMIAAFTEIRFKGDLNRFDDASSKAETAEISNIKYLVLPDIGENINISVADQPRIELRSLKGELLSKLEYKIEGDTLSLQTFDVPDDARIRLYIYVMPDALENVSITGATVIINDLHQQGLSITQKGGWLRMQGNNRLEKLEIKADNDASVDGAGFELDTLSLTADNATVRFYSPVNRLEGTISNESDLYVQSANELDFKKDDSSRWRLGN